jgi:hypothetical protein
MLTRLRHRSRSRKELFARFFAGPALVGAGRQPPGSRPLGVGLMAGERIRRISERTTPPEIYHLDHASGHGGGRSARRRSDVGMRLVVRQSGRS